MYKVIFYVDKPKKCHNLVNIQPIFNFKSKKKANNNVVSGRVIIFNIDITFLYTILDKLLEI